VLEAIRDGSAVALISLNTRIAEGPPEALRCAAAEVIGVNEQPMMVLGDLREAETGESDFIGTKPSQRSPLHPLKRI
jgi:hypothetical protein